MADQTDPAAYDCGEQERLETIRALYSASVSMWTTAGSDTVGRLNGFALTNAALVGGILLVLSDSGSGGEGWDRLPFLGTGFVVLAAVLGIIFTLIAGGAMLRSVAYARAYMLTARHAERRLVRSAGRDEAAEAKARKCSGELKEAAVGLGPTLAGRKAGRRRFRGFVNCSELAYAWKYEYVVWCLMVVFLAIYVASLWAAGLSVLDTLVSS